MKRPTPARKRRPWTAARVARIAHCAGAGWSAGEIADETGMSRDHVFRVLSTHRLALVPKRADQISFPIVISKAAMDEAIILGARFKLDPQWMVARLVEAVLDERPLAINLLDGVEAE